MLVSVVIVNYNVRYFLQLCLESVFRQFNEAGQPFSMEVIVVDNHSPDDSVAHLKPLFPQVIWIENQQNVGFSKANNQGFRQAKGEFVLVLNPDVVLPEDNLLKSVNWMKSNPEYGALGIRMLDGAAQFLPESKRGLPTPEAAFYKLFGLSKFFPQSRRFGAYHQSFLPELENNETEVLAGAWMLIRKVALDQVEGFDEQYFMYGEDIDLSYRLRLKGWKIGYFADSAIIHFKGESTRKETFRYVMLFYGAMIKFSKTHFSKQRASLFSIIIRLAVLFRASLSVLGRWMNKVSLPVADFMLILFSFEQIKNFWLQNIRSDEGLSYPPEYMQQVVPLYALVWIAGAFFGGAYDKPWRPIKHLRGLLVGTLVLAVIYAFLPLDLRYSRGLLLLGAAGAAFTTIGIRLLINLLTTGQMQDKARLPRRTLIVAEKSQAARILSLLQEAEASNRYLGYLAPELVPNDPFCLGDFRQLKEVTTAFEVDEIIFSAQSCSYASILQMMELCRMKGLSFRFHPISGDYVLGSDSIDMPGDLYLPLWNLKLNSPEAKRNKRLSDIFFSFFLLLLSPLLLVFSRMKADDFPVLIRVFFGRSTLVSYTGDGAGLPPLKKGWCSTVAATNLEVQAKNRADVLYAKNYSPLVDGALLKRFLFG